MFRNHTVQYGFSGRHIGPSPDAQRDMLDVVGADPLDGLLEAAMPPSDRTASSLDLPPARTETQVLAHLRALAAKNRPHHEMIGLGYYDTITPPVLRRNMLEESRLVHLIYAVSAGNLPAAARSAPHLPDPGRGPDRAPAGRRIAAGRGHCRYRSRRADAPGRQGNPSNRVIVDRHCFPRTRAVLTGRARAPGIDIVEADLGAGLPDVDIFGVLFQNPGAEGHVRDLTTMIAEAHARNALSTVATDLLAATLFTPPGEQGADIVVGSAQRFGVPLFFGGPHAGFMAVRDGLERLLPGRLVGVSRDHDGAPAYRLALQTREQHIRRDKATSNICTAQALLAIVAAMYAAFHGPDGLTEIARRVHGHATALAAGMRAAGIEVVHDDFFDTVLAAVPARGAAVVSAAARDGINLRQVDDDRRCVLRGVHHRRHGGPCPGRVRRVPAAHAGIPSPLRRRSTFLSHSTFHSYRSETAMMRYLRALSDKDLASDRTMIPLGSCTMKLNAAAEMEPISWPEFAATHPMAPADQTEGYQELIADLERWLADITGYDSVSLQPNAGSQGELAGLLAIRAYHDARGDTDRRICLIPQSAHGTNAASAVLAGLDVVVVGTRDGGDVDLDDLRAKLNTHRGRVAAIMITYPYTHGVYEHDVTTVCELVHAEGGQVYIDGANLNALVGLSRPGEFGGDVSHLNLHKTFCIPHGGGGPGVGPVAVRAHLAPYLPADPLDDRTGGVPVSAARYGSAGIIPITWAYLALMGPDGLRTAAQTAVLSANYLARRLAPLLPGVVHRNRRARGPRVRPGPPRDHEGHRGYRRRCRQALPNWTGSSRRSSPSMARPPGSSAELAVGGQPTAPGAPHRGDGDLRAVDAALQQGGGGLPRTSSARGEVRRPQSRMRLPAARGLPVHDDRTGRGSRMTTHSPLLSEHQDLGATFTDFAGWQMPLKYGSDLREHHAVRNAAGLFDLSHMGEIQVTGPQAAAALDYALAGRMSAVAVGRAKYSLLCDAEGAVLDDLVVYRLGDNDFMVVANASNVTTVFEEIRFRAGGFNADVVDVSNDMALLALQGPSAAMILMSLLDDDGREALSRLKYYASTPACVAGMDVLLARTGYTGEDGFELYIDNDGAPALWRALLAPTQAAEGSPAGLAARDSLRLEAGMALYGHELSTNTHPYEAGLGRTVVLDKDFVGAQALRRLSQEQPQRRLVALVGTGRRAARAGHPILADGVPVGEITSGALSPTLGYPIALGYADAAVADPGTTVSVDVRGSELPFTVTTPPFYKRPKP